RINLEADGESCLGRDARTDAAMLRASDRLMELQLVSPKSLASECVVTEYLATLLEHGLRIARNLAVEIFAGAFLSRGRRRTHHARKKTPRAGNPHPNPCRAPLHRAFSQKLPLPGFSRIRGA